MKVFFIVFSVICLITYNQSFASKHYVSPTGNASWAQSVLKESQTTTDLAFRNAKAGDTVIFLGGFYQVPQKKVGDGYSGYYNNANSGTSTNPIVFMANPGDTVIFDGTAGGKDTSPQATIFGTNNKEWIVYDGFTFQANNGKKIGRVFVGTETGDRSGAGHITVKNCIFNGGSDVVPGSYTDNAEGLRIEAMNNVTISNCYFFNFRQENNYHNTSALKTYDDSNLVVINCEFYNNTNALYYKRNLDVSLTENCFIHGNFYGIMFDYAIINRSESGAATIRNNLIIDNNYSFDAEMSDSGTHGNDFVIHNNTMISYGSYGVLLGLCEPGHGTSFYNNIVINSGQQSLGTYDRSTHPWRNYLKAIDHNQWGEIWKIKIGIGGRNLTYTTLAAWTASSQLEEPFDAGCGSSKNPGCGSIATDPGFEDGSGKLKFISDFRLDSTSRCRNAGRDGMDIGADVNIIGTTYNTLLTVTPPSLPGTVYADSTPEQTITWSANAKYPLKACTVSVSIDGSKTWNTIETVSGKVLSIKWKVPNITAPRCNIRVTVVDDSGNTATGTSQSFSIINTISYVNPVDKQSVHIVGLIVDSSTVSLTLIGTTTVGYAIAFRTDRAPKLYSEPGNDTTVRKLESGEKSRTISNLVRNNSYYFSVFSMGKDGAWSEVLDSTVLTPKAEIILPNSNYLDTLLVPKNTSTEVEYTLYCYRGDQSINPVKGVVTKVNGIKYGKSMVTYTVPAAVIHPIYGFRAFLTIKTEAGIDTMYIAKSVKRLINAVDNFSMSANSWKPISVTTSLDNPSLAQHISYSAEPAKNWNYDKTESRIIQWAPYNLESKEGRYYEYKEIADSHFDLLPGRLFWIKSIVPLTFDFNSSTTLPLNEPFTIPINASGWTDFSIPFNFPISINTILNSTNQAVGTNVFDSLEIYKWKETGTSFIAEPIYLPGIDMFNPDTTTINGGTGSGYTLYNLSQKSKNLNIVPLPYSPSNSIKLFKKSVAASSNDQDWGLKLKAQKISGEEIATSYISQSSSARSRFYQMAPTFGNTQMQIYDRTTRKLFGHMARGVSEMADTTFNVLFVNNSDIIDSCLFFIDNAIGFNDKKRLGFSGSNNVIHSINDSLVIPLGPHQSSMVTLYVGNIGSTGNSDAMLAQHPGIYKIIDGGMHGTLRFKLGIPATADHVKFQIFTISGKMLASKEIEQPNKSGLTDIQFNEDFSKGMYVVRLLINERNKKNMMYTKSFFINK